MRLIDADKLIEKLRDFKEWENDDGIPIHTMSETQRIDRCINFVQMEPTAYDANKVVERLNRETISSSIKESLGLLRAIEIVKQGGASDDVCEWKYNNSEYYWESSCEHLHIFMSDGPGENEYKYCPYCGKKIKVVE